MFESICIKVIFKEILSILLRHMHSLQQNNKVDEMTDN